jgi:hypothetical protein
MKVETDLVGSRRENFDRERIEIRADSEWIARVSAEADRLGLSLSAYIRLAVNERLERTAAPAPPTTRRGKARG